MKNSLPRINLDMSDKQQWVVTNDSVMGGLSKGKVSLEADAICFYGEVSTKNNGGFTSVYRKISPLTDNINALTIDILGDGNRYQFRLRTRVLEREIIYKVDFMTTAGKRQSLTFNLIDFSASFRGKEVKDAPLLQAKYITEVGFLIAPKCNQPFKLLAHGIDFITG